MELAAPAAMSWGLIAPAAGRRGYCASMTDGLGRGLDSPLASARYGVALGSDASVEQIRQAVKGRDCECVLDWRT